MFKVKRSETGFFVVYIHIWGRAIYEQLQLLHVFWCRQALLWCEGQRQLLRRQTAAVFPCTWKWSQAPWPDESQYFLQPGCTSRQAGSGRLLWCHHLEIPPAQIYRTGMPCRVTLCSQTCSVSHCLRWFYLWKRQMQVKRACSRACWVWTGNLKTRMCCL